MPEPKKHKTRGGSNRRRSHLALKKLVLVSCGHCGKARTPHRVCPNCGFYKNIEAVNVLEKELKKKEKKNRS
ncbi:MAG: 50S ribosomal protein L32 [Candidatus Yanofskybacteria bacterium CG10_big_fil_rev_8_21_14_0_10_36_16]|uniref:Large ribosomal subunit protein bL32 n=1 Tax=Candidatus Yanofskybacteria bacterium CG10_big_fil_rev_8_21_14_0_10_36_16 TaxID=1975096 RepID=A0A2J0QAI5_9BACT|nr:MAG: 50S ribosomal protein L32 [Candidatus Yanofskybacteria bacterium CG10_big_fil_rev_8_21_14_0_10_36_16]